MNSALRETVQDRCWASRFQAAEAADADCPLATPGAWAVRRSCERDLPCAHCAIAASQSCGPKPGGKRVNTRTEQITGKQMSRWWSTNGSDAQWASLGCRWPNIATRCVVASYVAMEDPNAGTVALLLSHIALAKEAWLASIDVNQSLFGMSIYIKVYAWASKWVRRTIGAPSHCTARYRVAAKLGPGHGFRVQAGWPVRRNQWHHANQSGWRRWVCCLKWARRRDAVLLVDRRLGAGMISRALRACLSTFRRATSPRRAMPPCLNPPRFPARNVTIAARAQPFAAQCERRAGRLLQCWTATGRTIRPTLRRCCHAGMNCSKAACHTRC